MRDEGSRSSRTESPSLVSALVRDHPGVLVRVAELFSRRGYNIEGLTVGPTARAGLSRMTISLRCPEDELEQAQRQLEKLVDVVAVRKVPARSVIARELALVKVEVEPPRRTEIVRLAEALRARVVDVSPETLTIEIAGDSGEVDGLVEALSPYGIREMARTGVSALERGDSSLSLN